MPKPEVSFKD